MLHQITPDKGGYMVDVSESSGLKSLAVKAVEVQEGRDWGGPGSLDLSCK